MGCIFSSPPNPLEIDSSHFSEIRAVGEGGFGKVFYIFRKSTNFPLASKRMNKQVLVRSKKHQATVAIERDVMVYAKSPFLLNLIHAYQDRNYIYFIMPFMSGGDLYWYLTTHGKMTENVARFYAAEILLSLEALHKKKILYRDLKPDNLLFDNRGHVKLSDFGLCFFLTEQEGYKCKGRWGTPGYMAPEVCKVHKPYSYSCDVWSFGITLYELLHNMLPFHADDINNKEVIKNIEFDPELSRNASSLIRDLLAYSPKHRLGCGTLGWDEVKSHPFFDPIDWGKISRKEVDPPFKPNIDIANYSFSHEMQDMLNVMKPDKEGQREPTEEEQKEFLTLNYCTGPEFAGPSSTGDFIDSVEIQEKVTPSRAKSIIRENVRRFVEDSVKNLEMAHINIHSEDEIKINKEESSEASEDEKLL